MRLVSHMASALILFAHGCTSTSRGNSRQEIDRHGAGQRELSAQEATSLAAELANAECARLYGIRPFEAKQYQVIRIDSRWHWGHVDPTGLHGLSAEVQFESDGSNPRTTIYKTFDAKPTPVLRVLP